MLSIIIPVKNEDQLIKNSIDRLLNEVKNIEFEIVIIDDFSEDRTAEIVAEILKKNNKVKLYSNKQQGLRPSID